MAQWFQINNRAQPAALSKDARLIAPFPYNFPTSTEIYSFSSREKGILLGNLYWIGSLWTQSYSRARCLLSIGQTKSCPRIEKIISNVRPREAALDDVCGNFSALSFKNNLSNLCCDPKNDYLHNYTVCYRVSLIMTVDHDFYACRHLPLEWIGPCFSWLPRVCWQGCLLGQLHPFGRIENQQHDF